MKLTPDQVVAGLVARGVPAHVAQGVVMNFQDESGLDTGIQEQRPTSGRGGFGLAQWTGPRRIQLEDFARAQGKRIDDPDAQLDFFMHENASTERGAWSVVMNSPNAQEAAVNFVNKWERPASQHARSRSAKYMGDSPSEGGAKFGGTGLGDPATAPAPSTWTHPLETPAAAAPVAAKPKTLGETLKAGAGDLLNNLGSIGGGGATAALPRSTVPQAGVPLKSMPLEAMAAGDTSAQDYLRNQLAQRMAMLNSGKLF